MINQIKYLLGAFLAIPFLPIMYFQGKKIRENFPQLPEAKGEEGIEGNGSQQINILTLGESTMAGVGVDRHQNGLTGSIAQYLAQKSNCKINWKVVAKSGFTAKQVAEQLIPSIKGFQPDLVIVGLGANDAFQLNSPMTWRNGMNAVFTRLNNIFPNSKIVCTNMPPIKEFPAFTSLMKRVIGTHVELLGKELKALSKNYNNVFYIDKKLKLEDWKHKFDPPLMPSDFFSDGVHPSAITYKTWGIEVGEYIVTNNLMELSSRK